MTAEALSLISPPLLQEEGTPEMVRRLPSRFRSAPPLGLLTLAAVVREAGRPLRLWDGTRLLADHLLAGRSAADFPEALAELLAADGSRFYGFGTMCDSYPGTLRCAVRLRQLRPDAVIFLGGPQASATAGETLARFPEVDAVLAGEAEGSLLPFLEGYPTLPAAIPGLFVRRGDAIWTSEGGAGRDAVNLDELPFPAYDLWTDHPLEEAVIEVGRGCPFACRFCSTSGFFGRRYRLKSNGRLLSEARHLVTRFGVRRLVFLHDHLAADRRRLLSLCEAWAADPELAAVPWWCSARLDSLDDALLETLAGSGCRRIFIGIESGSPRVQRLIGKRLDLRRLGPVMERMIALGMAGTFSFIVGFPEESEGEVGETLAAWCQVMARPELRAQLTVLAPLAGSAYESEWRGRLAPCDHGSTLLSQSLRRDPRTRALVAADPVLFSAHHALPLPPGRHLRLTLVALLLRYAGERFRNLLVAGARCEGSLEPLLERWCGVGAVDPLLDHDFYGTPAFPERLLAAAESLPAAAAIPAFATLVAIERVRGRWEAEMEAGPARGPKRPTREVDWEEPWRLSEAVLATDHSFGEIIGALSGGGDLNRLTPRRSLVVHARSEGGWRLEEPAPLAGAVLLAFCTPTAPAAVVGAPPAALTGLLPPDLPPGATVAYIIKGLFAAGLLVPASEDI